MQIDFPDAHTLILDWETVNHKKTASFNSKQKDLGSIKGLTINWVIYYNQPVLVALNRL